ncbi:CPBP family intramembrane glutamic endopeptidase [Halorientalis salina]|uniref:CPBP family intramembrane glutamic endopeptidase n=1 Tax=Halorientalis salina TaxID=2932266 RepID=UPI0010AB8982|nr:type II CAAX endopeptidase family protein [Halorientalis salina]
MGFRTYVWNITEDRPRAPVRLVVGFFLIAIFAVIGSVVADIFVAMLYPSISAGYYLIATTIGLGLGAVCGTLLAAQFIDHRPVTDYGFRGAGWWRDLFVGIAVASAVLTAALGVALAAGWVAIVDTMVAGTERFVFALVASVALFAVVGFYEELVFRGFVLKNVAEGLADRGAAVAVFVAVLVSSLLFGVVHLANANASLVSAAVIAVIAVTVAVSYVLTGRIGFAIGFHAAWNIAIGVLFGLPVSGVTVPGRVLAIDVSGPAVWTGGVFGLEAGMLGVLATSTGLAAVVVYARIVHGGLRIHPDILVPTLRNTDLSIGVSSRDTETNVGAHLDTVSRSRK